MYLYVNSYNLLCSKDKPGTFEDDIVIKKGLNYSPNWLIFFLLLSSSFLVLNTNEFHPSVTSTMHLLFSFFTFNYILFSSASVVLSKIHVTKLLDKYLKLSLYLTKIGRFRPIIILTILTRGKLIKKNKNMRIILLSKRCLTCQR